MAKKKKRNRGKIRKMAQTVELKKWSIRLYIIYSISADILVIGGILYLLFT